MRDLSRCCRVMIFLVPVGVLVGCQSKPASEKSVVVQPAQAAEPNQPAETVVSVQAGEPAGEVLSGTPLTLDASVLVPRITIEEPVVDLGQIGTDTKKTGKFEFTNTGKAPLKIVQVHSCCGVTTKGVDNGQEYAPGEKGTLEFEYLTGSNPIPEITRELRMQTNDPDKKIVSFTIKAAVVHRVEFSPAKLKLFLQRENAACEDIKLRSLDGKPFSVASVRSTANVISAEFDPNAVGTEFVLKLRADMEKLPRNVRGVVSINLTHPECINVRVPFDVLPEFTVNPGHLVVWNLKEGQAVQQSIQIIGNYQNDFEVESVSSQTGAITLLEQKKLEDRRELRIEIKVPQRKDDTPMMTDVIEVKIKDRQTVSIPFRGIYVEG